MNSTVKFENSVSNKSRSELCKFNAPFGILVLIIKQSQTWVKQALNQIQELSTKGDRSYTALY